MTPRLKGIFCIVASAFGFALMALFVRLCDDCGASLSCFEKSFFRNVVAFAIALAVFGRRRKAVATACPLRRICLPLLLRSVFGTLGIFLNFYALSRIPIGEGMTLNKTAPFFTVVFTGLLLGERITRRQFAWLSTAFAGALLVLRPGFRAEGLFAALCGLGGGLCAGLAYACVRQLGRLGADSAFVVLFFSGFSCLASLPFLLFGAAPINPAQIAILIGAGAGAALGQFGITAAYRFAEPRAIAAYDYTNVVFAAVLGYLFLGQSLDGWSVLGFLVILTAAIRMGKTGS